jgi:hypothetical protein
MKKEIAKLSEEQLAILNESYPINDDESRLLLPRFGMLAKDITEEVGTGKNKKINVIQPSGTFFTERDNGEVNVDTGKKVWTKTFIEGEEVDVIIAFHRRQLRKYDSSLEKFISTPIFDNAEQVVPLYLDKQVIKRGNQAQLQSCYPALTQKGKPTSDLKEETILYVVYKDELYQCNISQSSKWEFKTYKKSINPSTVVTTLGSVEETFGKNTYRKMTFTNKRMINAEEFDIVNGSQTSLKEEVSFDQTRYIEAPEAQGEKDFKALDDGKM